MDDAKLVRRLRNMDEHEPLGHDGWKAADRIEALIAENARLAKDYDVAKAFHDLAVSERNRARELNVMLETRAEKAEAALSAARDAALEEAAKVAEGMADTEANMNKVWRNGCQDAAAAIRALKGKSHE